MKIIKGNYGKTLFCDCMDQQYGLPSLQDNAFEVCWSDVPWGYEYDGKNPKGINQTTFHPERENYSDTFDPEFIHEYFTQMQRISKTQVLCTGRIHFYWWVKFYNPIHHVTIVFKNGQNSTSISDFAASAYYVAFGDKDFWVHHKFHRDVYETYITNGFLRDKVKFMNHPSPKDFRTWYMMIADLNRTMPKKTRVPIVNIVDPFAGTCCLAEVAECLGIPYLCYEIEEKYYDIANFRTKRGIQRHSYMFKANKNILKY